MKKYLWIVVVLLGLTLLCGCSEEELANTASATLSTAEKIVATIVENVDWDELKAYVEQGYDALVEKYPSLAGENIQAFLKDNGLKLMKKYLSSTDETMQENARKLGEIIKILNPELADEVSSVIG